MATEVPLRDCFPRLGLGFLLAPSRILGANLRTGGGENTPPPLQPAEHCEYQAFN